MEFLALIGVCCFWYVVIDQYIRWGKRNGSK